jgi:hypothetical protein
MKLIHYAPGFDELNIRYADEQGVRNDGRNNLNGEKLHPEDPSGIDNTGISYKENGDYFYEHVKKKYSGEKQNDTGPDVQTEFSQYQCSHEASCDVHY